MMTILIKAFKPTRFEKFLANRKLKSHKSNIDKLVGKLEAVTERIKEIDRDMEELIFYKDRLLSERFKLHESLTTFWRLENNNAG